MSIVSTQTDIIVVDSTTMRYLDDV